MRKDFMRSLARRGATAAAVLAMAAGGLGLSAGSASADTWYNLNQHPTGHGVGLYSGPAEWDGRVVSWALSSNSGSADGISAQCYVLGENINNGGDVWYRIDYAYSGFYGWWGPGTAYVYGAWVDGNYLFHAGLPAC